jgi:hypothetical protein
MKQKCSDPNLGALLPLYEIGGLSEEDTKKFELHMMKCDYCLKEVRIFQKYSTVLRKSDNVKDMISEIAERDNIWPKAPLIFRPGFTFILILIMLIPTIIGFTSTFKSDVESSIRPVKRISLINTRSSEDRVLKLERGLDIAIGFALPHSQGDGRYDVKVLDSSNNEIIYIRDFRVIDSRGMGELIFPYSSIRKGAYRLIASFVDSSGKREELVYEFEIQ